MRTLDGDDDSYDTIKKSSSTMIKIWRNEAGQIHRDGGLPAIIWDDGAVSYYKDGILNRARRDSN